MLRLHTFGGCFLDRDAARLDALSGQRKGLALLAVLAAAGDRGVSRDTLLAYFWPDSDEERARTSLKQLVHSLRQQLRAPELLLGSAELRLNPEHVASDVVEFRQALDRGDHAAAVALYGGPFLDGFYLKGAGDFERWAAAERAALAHGAARALEALAEQATARGDGRAAVEWWRRLANAEPLSARAATGLMRALDAAGERAAALQHARVYELLVREEVGGAPDRAVTELVDQLRQGAPTPTSRAAAPLAAAPPAAAPATAAAVDARPKPRRYRATLVAAVGAAAAVVILAGLGTQAAWRRRATAAEDAVPSLGARTAVARPSVAVLPFANTSGDPADDPFSDGLTDELIGALGKVPELRVAGRTSAFALKGKALGVRAVADTLGVGTVLEGSVRRAGDRLKVTTQLVNAGDDAVLWAETYDRELEDVFALQEEIAQAIVAALRVKLVGRGGATLVRRSTEDPAAYELYLRGRHILSTRTTRDGILQAARYFEQAVARDSLYARAYAGLSDAHARLAIFGYGQPHEEFARAKEAAHRALALDSTLAEAHASLGHALCVSDFEWDAAERELRRAIALDPGYTFARLPLAICLASRGRLDEAIAQLDTARAIDPISAPVSNLLGRLHVSARQPDHAIRYLREALEINPQLDLAYQQLGHAYLQKGMHEEAIAAFRRAAVLSGPRDSAQLAYAYAVTGQRAEARRVVRALVESPRRADALSFHVAMAYAGLGEPDEAFRWLERGYEVRASFMGSVKITDAFAPLHGDPRWPRLLRRMGLER